MSKIYEKYLQLKSINSQKLYLFKSGKFYIFIGDDCDKINDYVVLKKTPFSKESQKCGFPENVLDDYLRVFKNHNLDVEIVKDININKNTSNIKLLNFINSIDINKITPIEAFNCLIKIKEIINEENS